MYVFAGADAATMTLGWCPRLNRTRCCQGVTDANAESMVSAEIEEQLVRPAEALCDGVV